MLVVNSCFGYVIFIERKFNVVDTVKKHYNKYKTFKFEFEFFKYLNFFYFVSLYNI